MTDTSQDVRNTGTSDSKRKTSEGVPLRFAGCIGCSDMGVNCSGPNLLSLTIPELRLWANRWREYYKLSVAKCAAAWDVPEGTVSRFLSSSDPDFRYASIQSIVQGIIRYGQPADHQHEHRGCPATSEQIRGQVSDLEQQLMERTEECAVLTARKLERANEFTERMAEQRALFEKDLADKIDTIAFLKELAAKRQRDLEKAEAVAQNYLSRIDDKNRQIAQLNLELRQQSSESFRVLSACAAETKSMADRVLRMSEAHAEDFRRMHFGTNEDVK